MSNQTSQPPPIERSPHVRVELQALLQRFATPRKTVFRKVAEPDAAVWRELRRFTGDTAATDVLARHSRPVERAKQLRNAIRLADAYYMSYYDADETIDPVLLYY